MPDDPVRIANAALSGPDGKKLLDHLEDRFQRRKMFADSATKMAYQVGQYDAVEYLKKLLEEAKR